MVRGNYAAKKQNVTFFAGSQNERLPDITFGTNELSSATLCSQSEIFLGVAQGSVNVTFTSKSEVSPPLMLSESKGINIAPLKTHSIQATSRKNSIWFYAYACPEGAFHAYMGIVSKAGWQQEHPPSKLTYSSWSLEHPLPLPNNNQS